MTRILLVDDEPDVIRTVGQSLRKAGYEIVTASDGVEALLTIGRQTPDMVILDVSMPRLDGWQVCLSIRSDPQFARLPILFLTGHASVDERIRGLQEGADDYLAKPFDIGELRARVQALLRRAQYHAAPQLKEKAIAEIVECGTLKLNLQTFDVLVNNQVVQLTPAEFELLRFFMNNPNEVFSSQYLLQHVWNYAPDAADPGLVRWHVMNLRAKIETDPAHPIYLRTVPRHGYMFRSPTR
jgi:DNA-binding response OmpR family regulator